MIWGLTSETLGSICGQQFQSSGLPVCRLRRREGFGFADTGVFSLSMPLFFCNCVETFRSGNGEGAADVMLDLLGTVFRLEAAAFAACCCAFN
jgi:hypothetical protein